MSPDRSTSERIQLIAAEARLRGVAGGDAVADIHRAYRQLAQQHHPDRGGDVEQFRLPTAARDQLLARAHRSAELLAGQARQNQT